MAISILYNPAPMRIFEADGDFASGARGYFYLARTTTPLTVYTDAPLATPHTWPVIADAFGLFAPIYLAKGNEYKVRIEDQAGNILYAADGVDNPGELTGGEGGGGGLVVTASQIHQTGDFIWTPSIAGRTGWVRANGQTISSGLGTATTANDACQALFSLLWNTFSDTLCPVTPGGRGATPAADWDAAKSIATLDMRGRGAVGLDDMNTTAAELIQVKTAITTTNTSATATVADGTGLCRTMVVKSPNVPAGTLISQVIGNTLTMTSPATVTGSDATARFSMFFDAQLGGASGGQNTHIQSQAELYAHNHAQTALDGGGTATNILDGATISASGGNRPLVATTGTRWPVGVLATVGSTSPMNIQTPARVGTWWIKM